MQLSTNQSEKISGSAFLVTGGAGFIGSHITEFLLHAGARKVRVLDNLATGHFRNVAPFANHPRFEFTNGDVRDPVTCRAACTGMDYVFHLAAVGSVRGSIKDPVTTNSVDTSGFLNMLVAAHDAAVKRFVYASGSSGIVSPYAVTKYINELYADVLTRLYGMETIGLRYFNVFGQRHNPQSEFAAVIPRYVMQLLRHEAPVIDETEEYLYNIMYIEDVVQANILAMLTTDPKAINQVYTIAAEERTSLHQLAEYLKEFLSVFDESIANIAIDPKPAWKDNAHAPASIEKATTLLGYQPDYSLRNGLIKSAGWYWAYLPQFEAEAAATKQRNFNTTAALQQDVSHVV